MPIGDFFEENLIFQVFYTNTVKLDNITYGEINKNSLAYSLFTRDESGIYSHNLFINENGLWTNSGLLNLEAGNLFSISFSLISEYLNERFDEELSPFIIQNEGTEFYEEYDQNPKSNFYLQILNEINNPELSRVLLQYLELANDLSNPSQLSNFSETCTSACYYGSGKLCQPQTGECPDDNKVTVCSTRQTEIEIRNKVDSDYTFHYALLYDFRDNYLFQTEKGREYISYYYQISEQIDYSRISVNTLLKIVQIMPKVYSAVNQYKNQENVILIDDDFSAQIISILTNFEDIQYVNEIIEDISFLTNKTSNEIRDFLDTI